MKTVFFFLSLSNSFYSEALLSFIISREEEKEVASPSQASLRIRLACFWGYSLNDLNLSLT